MHVSLCHYLDTLRCILPSELLLQQAHHHLMDLCPTCRAEWDGRPHFQVPSGNDPQAGPSQDLAARPLPSERDFSLAHYDDELARQNRLRTIARRAREDVAKLRRIEPSAWVGTIEKSKTRFRSRAFVLLLLAQAKKTVRTAPRTAAAWAALVPVALDQRAGRESMPWARDLRLLALAHHANALRVAGDLAAADRELARLHRQLDQAPLRTRLSGERSPVSRPRCGSTNDASRRPTGCWLTRSSRSVPTRAGLLSSTRIS